MDEIQRGSSVLQVGKAQFELAVAKHELAPLRSLCSCNDIALAADAAHETLVPTLGQRNKNVAYTL